MVFVTFEKIHGARTGNILFQYLACQVISLEFGHQYVPIEEFRESLEAHRMDDVQFAQREQNAAELREKNIVLRGFFQRGEYYLPLREQLLSKLSVSEDYWFGFHGDKETIQDFLRNYTHSIADLSFKDVVITLRLDDFIQLPCPTSDIIPPEYYLEVLENLGHFDRLFIICDTLRHDWEHRYIAFFDKWNPTLLQKDLKHDCALMRDAPILLHSNSTLCWIMSFFSSSREKTRYIPHTKFYERTPYAPSQQLHHIDEKDVLEYVPPLYHNQVYALDPSHYWMKTIYPLSYCIPDECIIEFDQVIRQKSKKFAELIPGDQSTYTFGPEDEAAYHQMYQQSLFAVTKKKGGWDCLRHYEILANGCIPFFPDGFDGCPSLTLTTLPKDLIKEASAFFSPSEIPWNDDNNPFYDSFLQKILDHTRTHCSTSATIDSFFHVLPKEVRPKTRNVLLVRGNCGVNYTRETFWIGMKRYIQSVEGVAVETPRIDYLYKDMQEDKKDLYGNGYTYAGRLEPDYDFSEKEIEEKVSQHFFDMIIYGKVGPDEGWEGSLPQMPLWDRVFKTYSKNEIVFLYGGDECIDLTYENHYKQHILYHAQFAHCFVRELNML